MTQDAFDLFSWKVVEDFSPGDVDPPEPEPFVPVTVKMEVELPHPDAVLVVVRLMHDGTWVVSMRDRFGVGPESMFTVRAADPLTASRMIADPLVEAIGKRIDKDRVIADASAARRAALGAGGTYPSGRSVRPLQQARRVGRAESPTVTGPYTGSVPRNALLWDVSSSGVRVHLRPGLAWPDTGGVEERVFPTVRIAKDVTRGAVSG